MMTTTKMKSNQTNPKFSILFSAFLIVYFFLLLSSNGYNNGQSLLAVHTAEFFCLVAVFCSIVAFSISKHFYVESRPAENTTYPLMAIFYLENIVMLLTTLAFGLHHFSRALHGPCTQELTFISSMTCTPSQLFRPVSYPYPEESSILLILCPIAASIVFKKVQNVSIIISLVISLLSLLLSAIVMQAVCFVPFLAIIVMFPVLWLKKI
jgi:hypothetical protein